MLAEIIENLDVGILLCDSLLSSVLFSNSLGRSALDTLSPRAKSSPGEPLRATIEQVLESVEPGVYGRALPLKLKTGERFFVRAKALSAAGVLVTLTREVPREHELRELLARRYDLSKREIDLVLLLRAGMRNEEIAQRLRLSGGTVRQYLSRIFSALNVHGQVPLLALLDRLHLDEKDDD